MRSPLPRLVPALLSLVGVGVGLGACGGGADAPVTAEDGPRVEIGVAPLSLLDLGKVCYDLEVTNGPGRSGDVVWARGTPGVNGGTPDPGAVCSDRFGDGAGGAVTYVGPCDASAPEDAGDAAGERTNSVTLWIDGLYDAGGAYLPPNGAGRWFNPCVDAAGAEVGCTYDVVCSENADARVSFDLTVMRDAEQGFFDVAVDFDDVFCSAKVDCRERFLHHDGARDATVMVALACTSGVGERTVVHASDLALACDGLEPVALAASAGPGQQGPAGAGVYEWAVYQGTEALTSGGEALEKCFWNRAVGLDREALAGRRCRLTGVGSASAGGVVPPAGSSAYPIVRFDVEVLAEDGTLCAPQPLNGDGSGVWTTYLTPGEPLGAGEALTGTLLCGGCAATDTTCDGFDDDCDGEVDEDYVATDSTTCGVGVCSVTVGLACVEGQLVDVCEPGEPSVGVQTFDDDDANEITGSTFIGDTFYADGTGAPTLWAPSGGVGDSGFWYGEVNPAGPYATTSRHYGLVAEVSARRRLLGGRIEASFKTIGGQVRGFDGTPAGARVRWFVTARSSNQAAPSRIWVAKDAIEWNPNLDTDWTVHGIDVVYENFTQWNPFVGPGYVGTRADFEDTVRDVTTIGVFNDDVVMNFDVHLHNTWYVRRHYAFVADGPDVVRMGWDDVTYLVDDPVDDNCNGLDDDCDGEVDEDFVGPTATCGVGACRVTAPIQCVDGAPVCVPAAPSAEVCGDGIDNDCDGATDGADADCP